MEILGGFAIYIFEKSFVQELKAKINIVDILSRKLNVTKKGKNYWACCPFHQEKTPSFSINEQDQYYHCFGCGKSGDVITFLEENENLTYVEAVEELCNIAGVKPPEKIQSKQSEMHYKDLDAIYNINKLSARRYRDNLFAKEGTIARDYLGGRGIKSETVAAFGLGYSLDYYDLPQFLIQSGYTYESMLKAGLVAQNEENNDYYDAMGSRLIVPIINEKGEVIAFGGRAIKGNSPAKYKNTAQTLAFDKRKNLFAINILKKVKRESRIDYAILVEGYMDVISLYQAGITNSVASMGTSLTIEQCKLLKKYVDTVVVSFDGDTAGQAATMRSLDLLSKEGIEVKVVMLKQGLDPDDTIKRIGKNGFLALVDKALPLIDFKLKKIEDYYDLSILNNRSKYANTCIDLLSAIDDEIAANVYLDLVAKNSGTSIDFLKDALKKRRATPSPHLRNPIFLKDNLQSAKPEKKEAKKGMARAEDIIISALMNKKPFAAISDIESLSLENTIGSKIVKYIQECANTNAKFIIGDLFYDEIDRDEIGRLTEVIDEIEEKMVEKVYQDALNKLKKHSIEGLINQLNIKYISSNNEEEKNQIINKIKDLTLLQFNKKE